MESKVASGSLHGIRICVNAPVVHHLLFADDSLLFARESNSDCSHIQEVLRDYELAYGQKVNFGKSNIVFSKNVLASNQLRLASLLGVEIVIGHEKYLGLSTYIGRAKTEAFTYLKDRLSKRLNDWQGKLLSTAGRDILIRVVGLSLPNYAMSCFLLT